MTRAHGSRQPPPGLSRCLHVRSPARKGRLAASNQGCRSQSDDTVLGTQVEPRLNRATCTGAKAMANSEAATIAKVEVMEGESGFKGRSNANLPYAWEPGRDLKAGPKRAIATAQGLCGSASAALPEP